MGRVRILCAGSVNVDCAIGVDRFPSPGETRHSETLHRSFGGKGLNQAVAAARAGADVRLLGAVGDDSPGRELLAWLGTEGIDTHGVIPIPGAATGQAFAFRLPGGEVAIQAVRGANPLLTPAHYERIVEVPGDAQRVPVTFGVAPPVVAHLARLCRQRGVPLQVTPGSVRPDLLGDGSAYPTDTLFTPNAFELGAYLGREIRGVEDARRGVLDASRRYGGRWLATLGPDGCVLPHDADALHVPSPRIEATDTTGAGDCFSGVLAVLLCEGRELVDAARTACAAAALSCTRWGAASSMPTRAEIETFAAKSLR
ncbi:MAG: bifunctional hydroxymethylpyrimidine kinase/phosphomethylpyrimidine kinase [Planctomycetes bacterium]|nr:bifunctional hydroxymethylpyrimidine kinase/phosphomethylpyrimidine kinase [Planctomycetota bacterium]